MYLRRRRHRGYGSTAGLLTFAALAVAGCGSSSGTTSASPGSSTSDGGLSLAEMQADLHKYSALVTELPPVTPVPNAASLRGKTVWWVPLGPAVDAGIGGTLGQAFGKLGVTVHTCDGKFLPTTVASCLEQAGNQNAAAVMTGYVDYKSIPTAFDSLATKGIPVLLAGAINNSGRAQTANFAFADTTEILKSVARTQLEVAITEKKGKANLMWVAFDDSAQLSSITDYASSFVKKNCAECSFNEIRTNSAALPRLASQTGAALASHPDTAFVLVQVDPAAPSVLQAIQNAGRQSEVKVVGAGPVAETLLKLQSGNNPLIADSGVSTAYESWGFTQSLVQMMTGTVPPGQVQSIYRLFTPDNVKGLSATPSAYATVDWFASNDAVAATFAHAWGVR